MARGLIAALGVVVLATACGESPVFDVATLETAIPAALVPEAPEVVADVVCPEVLLIDATAVECRATVAMAPVDVHVDLTGEGTASISIDAMLVDMASIATIAAERLSDDTGVATTVSCPGASVIVSLAGIRRVCDAVDAAGAHHAVVVKIVDGEGSFELTFAGGGG